MYACTVRCRLSRLSLALDLRPIALPLGSLHFLFEQYSSVRMITFLFYN